MNIHTLTHIHALLIEDEKNALQVAKDARKRWLDADEADDPNKDQLREIAQRLNAKHTRSLNALRDFEDREW